MVKNIPQIFLEHVVEMTVLILIKNRVHFDYGSLDVVKMARKTISEQLAFGLICNRTKLTK